jgi:hypothetical protein
MKPLLGNELAGSPRLFMKGATMRGDRPYALHRGAPRFLAVTFAFAAGVCVHTALHAGEPPQAVLEAAQRIADRGYMSPRKACREVSHPGYEGLPTKRCAYSQGKLKAEVVLLDPQGPQLARWVNFTCEGLLPTGASSKRCGLALLQRIAVQSSGHFPVAGVVLENGKAYAFRDGVTVRIAAFANGTSTQLSAEQMEQSMTAPVLGWGQFARLQGTRYDDYRRFGRLTDGNGKLIDDSAMSFPQLVGSRWREEWGGSINSLMRAWACANRASLGITEMACVELPLNAPGAARNTP